MFISKEENKPKVQIELHFKEVCVHAY